MSRRRIGLTTPTKDRWRKDVSWLRLAVTAFHTEFHFLITKKKVNYLAVEYRISIIIWRIITHKKTAKTYYGPHRHSYHRRRHLSSNAVMPFIFLGRDQSHTLKESLKLPMTPLKRMTCLPCLALARNAVLLSVSACWVYDLNQRQATFRVGPVGWWTGRCSSGAEPQCWNVEQCGERLHR